MKIRIEKNDTLCVKGGSIEAVSRNEKYSFDKSEIEEIVMITTDNGPFFDDMGLAIRINAETAIFIMSGHPLYEKFLFDELGKLVSIDYNAIIRASSCTENKIFPLYRREGA